WPSRIVMTAVRTWRRPAARNASGWSGNGAAADRSRRVCPRHNIAPQVAKRCRRQKKSDREKRRVEYAPVIIVRPSHHQKARQIACDDNGGAARPAVVISREP